MLSRTPRAASSRDQSRRRRAHQPDRSRTVAGNRFPSDHMAGLPGAELGIRRSAKRSLWPTRISLSKHQRPQTRCPRLSPRRACGFRPGGERQQMPTMTRPSRVTRRAEPVPKEKHRAKHRGLIRLPPRACRNSVPLVGNLRRPPGARPLQTAPEGKTRAQGSRISGN